MLINLWRVGLLQCAEKGRPRWPLAWIERAGLLWLPNGDRLIALTENTATIETRTGVRHTFRHKPNEPARLLAWDPHAERTKRRIIRHSCVDNSGQEIDN
jgi:hypothetical protein